MDYSFEVCFRFGKVYLSDDIKGCTLILYPQNKQTTIDSILLDLKLAVNAIGITRIGKALRRESKISPDGQTNQRLTFGSSVWNQCISIK